MEKRVFHVLQHECDANAVNCLNWELARSIRGDLRMPRDAESAVKHACEHYRTTNEQRAEQDKADMAALVSFSLKVNELGSVLPHLPQALRLAHRANGAVQKSLFAAKSLKLDWASTGDKSVKLLNGFIYFEQNCARPTFLETPQQPFKQGLALYSWDRANEKWIRVAGAEEQEAISSKLERTGYSHSVFLTGKEFGDATVAQFGKEFKGCFVVTGME